MLEGHESDTRPVAGQAPRPRATFPNAPATFLRRAVRGVGGGCSKKSAGRTADCAAVRAERVDVVDVDDVALARDQCPPLVALELTEPVDGVARGSGASEPARDDPGGALGV